MSNSVSRYMDACLTIISYWQSDENLRNIPCIVNTMGFTRGMIYLNSEHFVITLFRYLVHLSVFI